jgi:hypothetical protein
MSIARRDRSGHVALTLLDSLLTLAVFCVFVILLAQTTIDSAVGDTAVPDVIYYGGKRVVFHTKREEVVLLDSAWVRYGVMSVYSDSILYDVRRHRLTAHKDVLFTSGSENITGSMLVYDVDSRKGMMRTARTAVENGFFRAREVWLVRERVLNARAGTYTTCDHDPPHYVFYGPRVKLLMDDIAITEPVVFCVGSMPLLAAPFWLVPVASKRKSGLMPFKVGSSSTEGLYSKNMAYYWVINDYSDMTFYADLMTKSGLQARAEGIYVVNPFAQGNLTGAYLREWGTSRIRYSLNGFHRSSRFLFGTEIEAKADFVSDRTYVPEYSEERLDWLKQDVFSYARLARRIRRVGSLSAQAERYVDFARRRRHDVFPSARLSLGSRPIVAGWTYGPGLSFSNRLDAISDSTGNDTVRSRSRSGGADLALSSPQYALGEFANLTLSDGIGLSERRLWQNDTVQGKSRTVTNSAGLAAGQRLLGAFSLSQGLNLIQSDNLYDTLPTECHYSATADVRTTLYRVFSTDVFNMRSLLHTVIPSAGLSYVPEVKPGGAFGRPRFLVPADGTGLRLRLENTFQGKFDTMGMKRDLGSLDLSSSYDLIKKQMAPLEMSAGVRPLQGTRLALNVDARATSRFESLPRLRDYSVATAFYWNGFATDTMHHRDQGLQLGLRHTLGGGSDNTALNMVTANAAVAAFGWKLSLNDFGYNFTARQLANYSLTLWRDLHCWEAIVNLQRLGEKWNYDFEVRIKKLPDVRFGKSLFRGVLPGS